MNPFLLAVFGGRWGITMHYRLPCAARKQQREHVFMQALLIEEFKIMISSFATAGFAFLFGVEVLVFFYAERARSKNALKRVSSKTD